MVYSILFILLPLKCSSLPINILANAEFSSPDILLCLFLNSQIELYLSISIYITVGVESRTLLFGIISL